MINIMYHYVSTVKAASPPVPFPPSSPRLGVGGKRTTPLSIHTHIHIYTHTYSYIYIYIYICAS